MRSLAWIAAASTLFEPSPSVAQRPGTLISSDPVAQVPAGMQAWRIRYWTSTSRGVPREVTGMIIAPRQAVPAQPRPVLAWAHGTSGVVERCGVSTSADFFSATPGLADAVRRGFVVAAPDYPGLGNGGAHPYLVGEDTARSVIDAVRAARGVPGAAAGPRYAVWGESQGAHAALWTAARTAALAPELQLVGAAGAAPPTELAANLRGGADPSIRAFLTAYTAYSWSHHYGAPLGTLGSQRTQSIINRLARNTCVSLTAKPKLGAVLGVLALRRDFKNVDLGRIAPWSGYAVMNSVPMGRYAVPLLIAQNPADKIVSPAVTRDFVRRTCRAGSRVRFLPISGKGHETSARDSAGATLDWIAARFAGAKAPSDCGAI